MKKTLILYLQTKTNNNGVNFVLIKNYNRNAQLCILIATKKIC